MEIILEAIKNPVIVVIIVFFMYWVMEWFKLVLKDKLKDEFIQPLCLLVGTLIATGVMYLYSFRPINLGVAKVEILDYLVQGGLLAGFTGTLYDKFFDKILQ